MMKTMRTAEDPGLMELTARYSAGTVNHMQFMEELMKWTLVTSPHLDSGS